MQYFMAPALPLFAGKTAQQGQHLADDCRVLPINVENL